MMLLFGFTVIFFIGFYFQKHFRFTINSSEYNIGTTSYRTNDFKSQCNSESLTIDIEAPMGYSYAIRKKTAFDNYFIANGFSKVHQTGNQLFDNLLYIDSDNSQLHRQLHADSVIVNAILKIFQLSRRYRFKVLEIQHSAGRLWVTYEPLGTCNTRRAQAFASEIVPLLQTAAESLESAPVMPDTTWKEPFAMRKALLLSFSIAMVFYGAIEAIRLYHWAVVPFTLNTRSMLGEALLFGAVIYGLLLIMTFFAMRRSAGAHRILMILLIAGFFGTPLTTFAQLHRINMDYDRSVGREYETQLLRKIFYTTRLGSSYYLYINNWENLAVKKRIKVTSAIYDSVREGDTLVITKKPGFLHYPWVTSIEKNSQSRLHTY